MPNLLSSLLPSSLTSSISSPIPPSTLRSFLRSQPSYVDNRERAAVVLNLGFKYYDIYAALQPWLFWGSILGAITSGYMIYKRRNERREAWIMWGGATAAFGLSAYITNPYGGAAPPAGTDDSIGYRAVQALDKKREALRATDPNFADEAFQRFADLPGIKESLDNNPFVKAAVV